jgi:NADPH:quinone reductase-like Zn-dependent oxidoreductase
MQYFTAYPLIDVARLQPNDAVIITAASSSVGLAAIQIANQVDAIPIAVTRGRGKEEALVRQGAKHIVVTDEEDVAERVDKITGGRGARVVFDAVGGNLLPGLVKAAAPGGTIILYGALGGSATSLPTGETIAKHLVIHGFVATAVTMDRTRRAAATEFVLSGLANGGLHPVIDRVFDFDDIAAAHRHLEGNGQIGKIVVRLQ